MNISVVKITPSKKYNSLLFVDVTLNDHGLLLKGIRCSLNRSKGKDGISVRLPSLLSERGCKGLSDRFPYAPVTFLSRDMHQEFIKDVKGLVSKLLKIADSQR